MVARRRCIGLEQRGVDRRPVAGALEFVRSLVLEPLRRVSRGRQLVRLRLGSRAKASRRVDAARLVPSMLVTSRATVAARNAARTSALWPPPRASGPAAGPTCATRAVFRRAAPRASLAATLAPPLTNFGRASVARGGVETVALAGRAAERRKRGSSGRGDLGKVSVKPVWVFYARTSPQLTPQRGRRS